MFSCPGVIGPIAVLTICLVSLLAAQTDSGQQRTVPVPAANTTESENTITVPDGTPIEMRFAQAVRGKMLNPVDIGTEAHPGDKVQLVAVADLRVGGLVVIAEGAIAQATVTKIKKPLTTLVATGLELQFNWVEDVTGAHIPLRVSAHGEQLPFMVQVVSTPTGVVARPETLHGDIVGRNAVDVSQIWRDREYIPVGTRITAYVYGSPTVDKEKLEAAQERASFSQFDTTADVTIYRTKGHGKDRPRFVCDGTAGRAIGEREYIHLNLSPGKHSCQVENQKPEVIAVERGEEYFFHLQRSGPGWELKQVTIGEGEDSIEDADPAPTR